MQEFPFREVSRFLWTFTAAFQVDEPISNSDQPITIPLTRPERIAGEHLTAEFVPRSLRLGDLT
jgi:hypothetical protein